MELKAIMSLGRFKDIITILLKYGFDDIVERLELPGANVVKKVNKLNHGLDTHERIRLAFQELGPTFVKFGQIMSLRPDLVPPDLIAELSKLQDEVDSVEKSQIQKIIEDNYGRPI